MVNSSIETQQSEIAGKGVISEEILINYDTLCMVHSETPRLS